MRKSPIQKAGFLHSFENSQVSYQKGQIPSIENTQVSYQKGRIPSLKNAQVPPIWKVWKALVPASELTSHLSKRQDLQSRECSSPLSKRQDPQPWERPSVLSERPDPQIWEHTQVTYPGNAWNCIPSFRKSQIKGWIPKSHIWNAKQTQKKHHIRSTAHSKAYCCFKGDEQSTQVSTCFALH